MVSTLWSAEEAIKRYTFNPIIIVSPLKGDYAISDANIK